MKQVPILYFSDVLCVWAFLAELRIDEARREFGDQVAFDLRFCSVFGDVPRKIATAWETRGGFDAYADHVHKAAQAFPETRLHADVWRKVRPVSSLSPHLYLKAVQLSEAEGASPAGTALRAVKKMREAFFVEARDVSRRETQRDVARAAGAHAAGVEEFLADARAHAALASDYKDAESFGVSGSPTMLFNEGRQKLYGNVGYRIIEANIHELLREPNPDAASWC
jgi:predicted DsbA family dithiol-disulfide isomerase